MRGMSYAFITSHAARLATAAAGIGVVGMFSIATPANAETPLQVYGGPGGNPARIACDPGSYVVGFKARAGGWLDQISIVCGRWNAKAQTLQPAAQGTLKGPLGESTGGDELSESCPDGWAVSAYHVRVMHEQKGYNPKLVHAVQFFCRPAIAGSGEVVHQTIGSWSLSETTYAYARETCPPGELVTGAHGRAGHFVDALGLICNTGPVLATAGVEIKPEGPVVATGPIAKDKVSKGPIIADGTGTDVPTSYPLRCRGGGNMLVVPGPGAGEFLVTFTRSPDGAAIRELGEGQCAWLDRAISIEEPQVLHFYYVAGNAEIGDALQESAKKGGSFEVSAYNDANAGRLQIASVNTVTPPPTEKPAPPAGPSPTDAACGPPGGTGVVTIADPKLTRLNVRTEPGGPVLGTIPEGAEVSIIGPCGPAGSAGLKAPDQPTTGSGWCQIDRPIEGCVAAQFLALGETAGAAGLAKAPPPEPKVPSELPSPQSGAGVDCGVPAGLATVVIPQPNLDKLNVRESPGGAVVATVPEGSQVLVIGPCGPDLAAGIAAPSGQNATPGWCQIDAPVTGCVSARFLAAAGDTAGLAAKSGDEADEPGPVQPSFAGEWDSDAGGVHHVIILRQKGSSVTGSYTAADGSAGKIVGKLNGRVLRFSWTQADGAAGSGKFALSGDGLSFTGSYNFGDDADVAEGAWNGSRR